jgi:DNA-directed RNA polymerase subunit delta
MLNCGNLDTATAKVAYPSSAAVQLPLARHCAEQGDMTMLTITGLNCIYDTGSRGWAMELAFADDTARRRFDVDSVEDAEMLIEAFEESSSASFDAESGEIRFAFEYASAEADEEEGEDEDVAEDEDDDGQKDDDDTKRKVA